MSKRHKVNRREKSRKQHSLGAIYIAIIACIVLAGTLLHTRAPSGPSAASAPAPEVRQVSPADISAEYQRDLAVVKQYLPGIICWGDSLTAGAGGDGVTYPNTLQDLIDRNICQRYDLLSQYDEGTVRSFSPTDYEISIPVYNMGVGGETTYTILGRNGAIPFVTCAELSIPAEPAAVEIHFISQSGKDVAPLRQGARGMSRVIIDGIEGVISIEQETNTSSDYKYLFTRSAAGEARVIPVGTELITDGSLYCRDYITVIYIGTNGEYSDAADLIAQQRAILNHQTANADRFIIVGLHQGIPDDFRTFEAAMAAEYGEQYINVREYMSTQALSDAGLTPTAEDQERIADGLVPSSLLSDQCHFNADGYTLLGQLIYDRMDQLGYFNEIRAELGLQ